MSSNWRDLALLKNEFVFRGISHQYDEVSSIHFYDKVVTTSVNAIPAGKSYAINLTVSLENVHEPLLIKGTCRSSLLAILGGVRKHIEPIRELYVHFAARTFEKRATKYLDQITWPLPNFAGVDLTGRSSNLTVPLTRDTQAYFTRLFGWS